MSNVYKRLPDDLRAYVEDTRTIHDGRWRYKIQAHDEDRALIDIFNELLTIAPLLPIRR